MAENEKREETALEKLPPDPCKKHRSLIERTLSDNYMVISANRAERINR